MVEAEASGPNRDYGFGVLGPLRVTRAGVPLSLGGRQQRAVLARLLLADGAGLTVDQLADALWGNDVPAGAAGTIQTYVFHLRRVIEPDRGRGTPGQVVITDQGRYRLAIGPDALDSAAFERRVDAGERLLAGGAPAEAASEFDQALALWRGDVLADLADYEFVAPVATRLADRRKAAVEAKIDAELALGRHASVLSQLNELVAEDPLNERLQGQRIVSLYRSGRPSDALAAYDQLRQLLADELGVDPSPPLQQLHQQVLAHDPALAWYALSPREAEVAAEPDAEAPERGASTPPPRRRRPRLRRRWLVTGVVLLVVAAVGIVTAIVVSQNPKHTLAALPPNSVGILDNNGALHDAVPVGQNPDALAYGFGSLWVANSGENTVQRVNPKTAEVIQTFPVGANPDAIAFSAHDVWVANGADGTVTEIDPEAIKAVDTLHVGALPAAVAVGPGVVWVANSGDDDLSRIDIESGHIGTVQAGDGPDGLLVDGDSLWVANGADGTVSHLDATTGDPLSSSVRADAGASGLLLADGALWVANQAAQNVTRIDPKSEPPRTTATIPVGDGPHALVAAHGAVWASNEYGGAVSRIDPKTNNVTHAYSSGGAPHGLAIVGKDVWLSSAAFASGSHVGGTLTFEASRGDFLNSVDPATAYNPEFGIVGRAVYDGLVAYRATSGTPGVALVPDLAVRLPIPEDGGRRYTFTIRKGIRYSNGLTVQASDLRRGILRELTIGQTNGNPAMYSSIVGAPACIDDPKHCDLSAGVQVDDVAGRITFHLSKPDPAFLDKLAQSLVVATPPGAPSVESATPLPSTGPYQITFVKGQSMVLRRNPHFSRWSYAAQPDGYPDVIRFVKGKSVEGGLSTQQAANRADIIAGRADVIRSFVEDEVINKQLHARYPASATADGRPQLHDQVRFDTQYLQMDTRFPPFNNQNVRRAVNYAFDRPKFAAILGGNIAARPTCQILPPGFPGHVTFCPFTGANSAPNVALARSLVASSGSAGMPVDIYGQEDVPEQLEYVASVLRDIGYRPVKHFLADDGYQQFVSDPSHRVPVAISEGWIPDYPRPDAYFDFLFSCRPDTQGNNAGHYCRPDVDDLVVHAKATQLSDPPAALKLWNQIDRRIVDDAPIVPTVNQVMNVFTSARVGNVETTPSMVFLIDQMWVQ
jgi:ABC-type transport system substrate-binding protein/DNA-binding SARP family transcriptional activator